MNDVENKLLQFALSPFLFHRANQPNGIPWFAGNALLQFRKDQKDIRVYFFNVSCLPFYFGTYCFLITPALPRPPLVYIEKIRSTIV